MRFSRWRVEDEAFCDIAHCAVLYNIPESFHLSHNSGFITVPHQKLMTYKY
jgi:hypothetical protein